jgi:uncharacterized protein YgbK (DUF1537 family)
MTPRLFILADDFTGALDTGVRLAAAGVAVHVVVHRRSGTLMRPPRIPSCREPVIVVDTESRHGRPAEAARRVRGWVRSARRERVAFLYKKTDSTLRGNVGAELSALLLSSGEDDLYFVPALPAAGRTTVGGVAFLNGVPLHLAGPVRDPNDPVTRSEVSAIIAKQTDVVVENVPRGSDPPPPEDHGKRILVFDAETDADLEDVGRRIKSAGIPRATAGCSGFASVLPQLLDLPCSSMPAVRLDPPMLVVCGSLAEVSLAQVGRAEAGGFPSFMPDCEFLAAGGRRRTLTRGLARGIADALVSQGAAILKTASLGSGEQHGRVDPRAVPRALGAVAREVATMVRPSTLVLFGGDTAFGVVEALGIRSVQPLREISQGVVVSRAENSGKEIGLVTKAGGFGPPDILLRIRETLGKEP